MNKSRFTDSQIMDAVKRAEAGINGSDLCQELGISVALFCRWRAKYGGLTVSEAQRHKALESENSKLKCLLAESLLDNAVLKDIVGRKWRAHKPGVKQSRI
jgi:putative transposase